MPEKKTQEDPWHRPGKWLVTEHNFNDQIRDGWNIPKKVIVHDCTLRDGEQTPGVVFTKAEKLNIAHALADIGVHRIEAGMAAVSEEDREAIVAIAKEVKTAEIAAFARARQDDIDNALKCNVGRIVLEVSSRPQIMTDIWGSVEKAVENMAKMSRYAKERGAKVTCFFPDSSRRTLETLRSILVPVAQEGKPDSIGIVDTLGSILPWAFAWLVREVKKMVDLPIEVHCHNRWGLGTANTLAGVISGAEVVHATINGLNENSALDEVVIDLAALVGIDTGVRTEGLLELAKMTNAFAQTPWFKAFVGDTTWQMEVGVATHRLWSHPERPIELERSISPQLVGLPGFEIVLGKKSGKSSIFLKARQLGLAIPSDEQAQAILEKVKRISLKDKRLVNDDEFRKLYASIVKP